MQIEKSSAQGKARGCVCLSSIFNFGSMSQIYFVLSMNPVKYLYEPLFPQLSLFVKSCIR